MSTTDQEKKRSPELQALFDANKEMFDSFGDALNNPEPLHPELTPYLEEMRVFGGHALKHPLVFAVPYFSHWNKKYNAELAYKRGEFNRFVAEKQWGRAAFITERPYRVQFLHDHADQITDDNEYWDVLSWVYSDSENLWQNADLVAELLDSPRPGREKMMDDEERELLAKLPGKVRVYRGHGVHNQDGFAWTLSSTKAWWFARRMNPEGAKVSMAFVSKPDIYAYLSGRGEYEIVTAPDYVQDIETYKFSRMSPGLKAVLAETQKAFKLGVRSDHGPNHWRQVERLGIALCKANPKADKEVVRLFALIHDHLRENEMDDPLHGHRAAKAAPAILDRAGIKLDFDRMNLLLEAMRYHNDGLITDCPTIGTCWDADRLDLPRVGIIPDPKLLSTKQAKERILQI
jgi:uncharacterized protein